VLAEKARMVDFIPSIQICSKTFAVSFCMKRKYIIIGEWIYKVLIDQGARGDNP
jgi:hypothetical protein